jgi:hypothetical protein
LLVIFQNIVGEWALPEEMIENVPPPNNYILGHVLHRLIEKSLPPQVETTEPESPSLAVKGCLLGKTLSGKTTILKAIQKGRIPFSLPYWIPFTLPSSVNVHIYRKHIRDC